MLMTSCELNRGMSRMFQSIRPMAVLCRTPPLAVKSPPPCRGASYFILAGQRFILSGREENGWWAIVAACRTGSWFESHYPSFARRQGPLITLQYGLVTVLMFQNIRLRQINILQLIAPITKAGHRTSWSIDKHYKGLWKRPLASIDTEVAVISVSVPIYLIISYHIFLLIYSLGNTQITSKYFDQIPILKERKHVIWNV